MTALAVFERTNAGVPGTETPVTATVEEADALTVLLSGAVALKVALFVSEKVL